MSVFLSDMSPLCSD